ncbi:12342_t:CDS:2, partial [Entrophospora sp. SA101]
KPKRILSESQNHLVAEENPHLNDDSINWEFGMPTWLTKVISYWEKHISLEDQFKKMDETNFQRSKEIGESVLPEGTRGASELI